MTSQIVNECLSYPTSSTFSHVIGLANRPLKREDTLLPQEDTRWDIYGGMDLEKGVESVAAKLRAIKGIEDTTHAYFTGAFSSISVTTLRN